MDFVGLFKFAVKCFDILAWPLFAFGYPLCASIEAIETNSNSETQKLITYWISLSLILLFEHAFAKLLVWVTFWPYIRLVVVCCLVVPQFDGSLYTYKHLVHPCLSLDLKIVTNQFKKLKVFLNKDNLQVEVDRHKYENRIDALEKFIAFKPKFEEHKVAHKGIDVVEKTENKETASKQLKFEEVAFKDVNAVEIAEKNAVASTKQVRQTEPGLTRAEDRTFAPLKMKEVETAAGGWDPPEMPSKKVQKEWTCAICQVRTTSEIDLHSHLRGQRHRDACKELKPKNEKLKSKVSPTSAEKTSNVPMAIGAAASKGNPDIPPSEIIQWTCPVCPVMCTSKIDFRSHLRGLRHKAACEELKAKNQTKKSKVSPTSVEKTSNIVTKATGASAGKGFPDMWTCAICSVQSKSEIDFRSHLQGKRHKAACEALEAKNQPLKSKISPTLVQKSFNIMPEGESEQRMSEKGASPKNTRQKSKMQENLKSQGVEIRNSLWWCTICDISCTSKDNMDSHLNGNRHLARTRELNGLGESGHT